MEPNPYDPLLRTDLGENAKRVLHFMQACLHGRDESLIDAYVREDYIQHTPGIGQGREGLRRYLREVAWKRPGRHDFHPVHLFEDGDFVILHKLLPAVVIVDIMRLDSTHLFAEHWDVVQRLPEPGYDPMRRSREDLSRFMTLFTP